MQAALEIGAVFRIRVGTVDVSQSFIQGGDMTDNVAVALPPYIRILRPSTFVVDRGAGKRIVVDKNVQITPFGGFFGILGGQ